MLNRASLFVLLYAYICNPVEGGFDPCSTTNHTVLDDPDSLRSNHTVKGQVPVCDRFIDAGWYRVMSPAGGDMVRSCPEMYHCSTDDPIWLKDDLPPPDGQIYPKAAYIRMDADCEGDRIDIEIKNCGTFNVYKLTPPGECYQAYCFGEKGPCPDGQSSPTGREPCFDTFPEINEDPVLGFTVKKNDNDRLEIALECKLQSTLKDDVKLETIWYKDDVEIITIITDSASPNELKESEWYTEEGPNLNVWFSCRLRGFGENYGAPGPWKRSNQFFAGVQAPSIVRLDPDITSAVIELEPTVPILNKEALQVDVQIPRTQSTICGDGSIAGLVVKDEGQECGTYLKGISHRHYDEETWREKWDEIKSQKVSLHVYSTLMDQSTEDRYLRIKMQTDGHSRQPIWGELRLPDVPVIVSKNLGAETQGGARCHCRNDPHLITFDQCPFENHLHGEFVLYHHKVLKYQVNVWFEACKNRHDSPSCNCGVVVKAGRDSFVMTYCKRTPRLGFINCPDGSLKIQENSGEYTITFPTGTAVIVNVNNRHYGPISFVDVISSSADVEKTEGLCGFYNNEKTDDFYHLNSSHPNPLGCPPTYDPSVNPYSKSWQVPRGSDLSLWNGFLAKNVAAPDKYCVCSKDKFPGTVNCDAGNLYETCRSRGRDITNTQMERCKPRSLFFSDLQETDFPSLTLPPFEYNDVEPKGEPTWPDGWTEETARTFCNDNIMGTASGSQCGTLSHVNYGSIIEECMEDIKLTGDTEWVSDSQKSMQNECRESVLRNVTLWETEGNVTKPPANILNTLCPSGCNGQGTCENGICVCNEGFASGDCSINLSLPPNITGIDRNGECATNTRPCQAIALRGSNFAETANLTCKIGYKKITENRVNIISGIQFTRGLYMHPSEIVCPLFNGVRPQVLPLSSTDPPLGYVYTVSVSNDGVTYGNESNVVAFNGQCVQCDSKMLRCQIQENKRRITGSCFNRGDTDVQDPCATCDPTSSTDLWTLPSVPSCRIQDSCYGHGNTNPFASCQACNVDTAQGNWTLQTGFCFIESRCVSGGESSPDVECNVCDPDHDVYAWTAKCQQPNNVLPIALGVGAAVIVICAGTGATVVIMKKKRVKVSGQNQPPEEYEIEPTGDKQ